MLVHINTARSSGVVYSLYCSAAGMEVFALVAALVVGLATSLLLALVALTTYLASVHRRYAHIPTPEGAS